MSEESKHYKNKLIVFSPDKLWNDLKDIIPKSMTMNEAILELIREKVEEKKGEPYYIDCPECGGSGKVEGGICPTCNGSGHLEPRRI